MPSVALFLYDYLITLDREVRYIWSHKFCNASVIFFILRYSYLTAVILGIMDLVPLASKTDAVRC